MSIVLWHWFCSFVLFAWFRKKLRNILTIFLPWFSDLQRITGKTITCNKIIRIINSTFVITAWLIIFSFWLASKFSMWVHVHLLKHLDTTWDSPGIQWNSSLGSYSLFSYLSFVFFWPHFLWDLFRFFKNARQYISVKFNVLYFS